MPKVEVSHVTKRFGEGTAVNDVSFVVKDGSFTTLLGPSGCGKTTTLRMLAGFEHPDAGEIAIGERVVAKGGDRRHSYPPNKRNVGVMFQSYALWPHMTVFDQVAYPLKVRRMSKTEVRERVASALDLVGLKRLAGSYPGELSGGQQQRIAFARAIVFQPSVLLLDEPLSNLDVELRKQMREELGKLHDTLGITFVYVTHDQSEALALSDQILLMKDGAVVESGTPRSVFGSPSSAYAAKFLGGANQISAKLVSLSGGIAEALTNDGVVVRGVAADLDSNCLGASVAIAVRPDQIQMVKPAQRDAENVLSGHVSSQTYLGARTEVCVSTGVQTLRVSAPSESVPNDGDAIALFLPPSNIRVLKQP